MTPDVIAVHPTPGGDNGCSWIRSRIDFGSFVGRRSTDQRNSSLLREARPSYGGLRSDATAGETRNARAMVSSRNRELDCRGLPSLSRERRRPVKTSANTEHNPHQLTRRTFSTSRSLEFFSEKELTAQLGHSKSAWGLVLVKELVDNALDACEESKIQPSIHIEVTEKRLTVKDNGPGIQPEVVCSILDFSSKVSSREAYVSPTRGAQGNALKTVLGMAFVVDGKVGTVSISACGVRHQIAICADRIHQQPTINYCSIEEENVEIGTSVTVESPCSVLFRADGKRQDASSFDESVSGDEVYVSHIRLLNFVQEFAAVNPHLHITLDWFGVRALDCQPVNEKWKKWLPSDPTSAHWYTSESFERLIAAHLSCKSSTPMSIREFVSDFRGFATSASQKKILDATGLHRRQLSSLLAQSGNEIDLAKASELLTSMKSNSKSVNPKLLGVLGRDNIAQSLKGMGCEMDSYCYQACMGTTSDELPWVLEVGFAWNPESDRRRMIAGVNWSPAIINPFRELGRFGESLDSFLERLHAGPNEPIVILIHLVCPRVTFADRGKSTLIMEN